VGKIAWRCASAWVTRANAILPTRSALAGPRGQPRADAILPMRVNGRGCPPYSGPAYFPAVWGNIDLTIFIREMSVVASMCRKIAASR
jgi:hypothetical protein